MPVVLDFVDAKLDSMSDVRRVVTLVNGLPRNQKKILILPAIKSLQDRLSNEYKQLIDGKYGLNEYCAFDAYIAFQSLSLAVSEFQKSSCLAKSFNAYQLGSTCARDDKHWVLQDVDVHSLLEALKTTDIIIMTSEFAVNEEGELCSLSGEHSKWHTLKIAANIQAQSLTIVGKDEGIYSCDRSIVAHSRQIECISYPELKVICQSIEYSLSEEMIDFAEKFKLKLHLAGEQTLLSSTQVEIGSVDNSTITAITFEKSQLLIELNDVEEKPGIVSLIIRRFEVLGIKVTLFTSHLQLNAGEGKNKAVKLLFNTNLKFHSQVVEIIEGLSSNLGNYSLKLFPGVAKVCIIGERIRHLDSITEQISNILAAERINLFASAVSEHEVSVILEEKYLELSLRTLHSAFGLDANSN